MSSELDLQCEGCNGTGSIACTCNCPHCDNDEDCDECDGTGFNPELVDLDAWTAAVAEFRSHGAAWPYREGIIGEGKLIGLRGSYTYNIKEGTRTLSRFILAKDYLINKDEQSD